MSGFPINVDLSFYFDDLRKYSVVFVNLTKFKTVGDVENHMKSIFKLGARPIYLTNKKCHIPRGEDVQILQHFDIIKVQNCDYYETQVLKNKRDNSTPPCDQKALNLIQTEKTIDLSCKPQQKIKTNICQSCISGASPSKHLYCQQTSINNVDLLGEDENQLLLKERQKHKRKKHFQNSEGKIEDDDETILDMSISKSKRKKHTNCFSTDDGHETHDENKNDEICYNDLSKSRLYKKEKKRKRHSDEDFDANPFYDKHLEHRTKSKNTSNDVDYNGEIANHEEYVMKKKNKKSKKSCETRPYNDGEKLVCSSTPRHIAKKHNNEEHNMLKSCSHKQKLLASEQFTVSKTLEECKKTLTKSIDERIDQLHQAPSKPVSLSSGHDESSTASFFPSNSNDTCQNNDNYEDEKQEQESSEIVDKTFKTKRKRKHSKRKKKERLLNMSAVGPTLTNLITQPDINVKYSTSEIPKHIFFTENDSGDGMEVPPTTAEKFDRVQGSPMLKSNHLEECISSSASGQGAAAPNESLMWQHEFLQLVNTTSRPIVIHRNASTSNNGSIMQSQQHTSSQDNLQHSSNVENPPEDLCNGITNVSECVKSCNDDKKTVNDNAFNASTSGACEAKKKFLDVIGSQPIPNDLQNINPTNYPIINKVVVDDLILFKMLKLNENKEPEVSKTILAKVNDSSRFPEKVLLQIMGSCDESGSCENTTGDSGASIIELRWSEILEPRLFYP